MTQPSPTPTPRRPRKAAPPPPHATPAPSDDEPPSPEPPARLRHDGWTPERQMAFLDALAESGCVAEACASVGKSRQAAYALRARVDAQAFRLAWDAALDYAIRRLSDECLSRALNGVPVPHFFRGEKVGEHRRYDTRLALFLLRYRDPLRYAATLDRMVYSGDVEGAAIRLSRHRDRAESEAWGVADFDDPIEKAPFEMVPLSEEQVRQDEEALIRSNAPIYGDTDRRLRLSKRRAAYHVAKMTPEQRQAQAEAEDAEMRRRIMADAAKLHAEAARKPRR